MKDIKSLNSISRVMEFVDSEMGLSNAEFCRRIEESTQNLNNWINRGVIPGEKLEKVSKVINRSVDWILTGTEFVPIGNIDVSAESATSNGYGLVARADIHLAIKFLSNPPKDMKDIAGKLVKLINSMSDLNATYNSRVKKLTESLRNNQT